MFVAARFLSNIVEEYGEQSASPYDGGTWYPQDGQFLNLKHHIHFLYTRMRRTLLKEQCGISKTELGALMIIFQIGKRNVN
jgi:hypothetical protein